MNLPTDVSLVPGYIEGWYGQLRSIPFAQAVPEPNKAAVFSADMVDGFCKQGNLASERVRNLIGPVVDLFQLAHGNGIRDFVLLQDTHHPQTPEFEAWPVHCVRDTNESETVSEIAALPFSGLFTVIEKNSLHPGLNTRFDQWLEDHPALRTAIVAGDCTDLCVYQLAMHLRLRANAHNLHDFEVIVPENAVQTYDLPEDATREVLAPAHPGDFFHRVFLYHMALNGITIVRALV